ELAGVAAGDRLRGDELHGHQAHASDPPEHQPVEVVRDSRHRGEDQRWVDRDGSEAHGTCYLSFREIGSPPAEPSRRVWPAVPGRFNMAVPGGSVLGSDEGAWIHNRRFDLVFLTLSGVLVFLPYLSYGLLQRLGASPATASLIIGLGVTLLVGGPHMYSTYL